MKKMAERSENKTSTFQKQNNKRTEVAAQEEEDNPAGRGRKVSKLAEEEVEEVEEVEEGIVYFH